MTCVVTKPDTSNFCSPEEDDVYIMPGFCALLPSPNDPEGGNGFRKVFCEELGSAGEWIWDHTKTQAFGNPCLTDPSNFYSTIAPIFCAWPQAASGVGCTRVGFNGNPTECALQDYFCTNIGPGGNDQCFTGTGNQSTCSPSARNIASKESQDVLLLYCTGTTEEDTPGSLEWFDRWTTPSGGNPFRANCLYALERNLYRESLLECNLPAVPTPPYNAEGYFWAQKLMQRVIQQYNELGYRLGSTPGTSTYHPFQDFLYSEVCLLYPGLCTVGLTTNCADYTADQVSRNPYIANWCGCYLNAGEYENYSVAYNIPPQCTPMCNRVTAIPISGINGEPVKCTQNICIIDNTSINIVNSQIQGGIDINQVCGSCGPEQQGNISGQCSCIIDNTTIDVFNSDVGQNIVVSETCGQVLCTQINTTGVGPSTITVPCTSGNEPFNPFGGFVNSNETAQEAAAQSSVLYTLLIVLFILVVAFLIWYFLH